LHAEPIRTSLIQAADEGAPEKRPVLYAQTLRSASMAGTLGCLVLGQPLPAFTAQAGEQKSA
jgi:hypothetical protein